MRDLLVLVALDWVIRSLHLEIVPLDRPLAGHCAQAADACDDPGGDTERENNHKRGGNDVHALQNGRHDVVVVVVVVVCCGGGKKRRS